MSTFKLKPKKQHNMQDIKTLDEHHKKIVAEFTKRKMMLPSKKQKLNKMKTQLENLNNKQGNEYTNDDIKYRSQLKTNIQLLEEEIYDTENNISEIDYYSKTDEVLMDYYELLDNNDNNLDNVDNNHNQNNFNNSNNVNDLTENLSENFSENVDKLELLNIMQKQNKKIKKTTRRRKKKFIENTNNNILSYFGTKEIEIKTELNNFPIKQEKIIKDRSELLEQYKLIIDNSYICKSNKYNYTRICSDCNIEKTLIQSEGQYVCEECGDVDMVIIESEKPNYKDVVPEKPGYPYKRIKNLCIKVNIKSIC